MENTLTLAMLRERLHADSYSLRKGVATLRFGFFYTSGRTAEDAAKRVKAAFPNASILEFGEVWKPFNGGASVANQSHWYVTFTVGSK